VDSLKTAAFDYDLPLERIAQTPLERRDESKLLTLNRQTGEIAHRCFVEMLDFFEAGDVLVGNNSRVMPARLHAQKTSGGKVELLLLEQLDRLRWKALAGGKKLNEGTRLIFPRLLPHPPLEAEISEVLDGSQREVTFDQPLDGLLDELGEMPLPPYIHTRLDDGERYQTIYSHPSGSAAAPTAGLHFTPDLLLALRQKGVLFEQVTLHVGLDTFKPVEVEQIRDHPIHSEWARLTPETAKRINEAKLAGKKIIAIGTTSVRVLETAAWRSAGQYGSLQGVSQQAPPGYCPWKLVAATEGRTDLYIYPGYHFRAVDGLITNFHMPQSTLMMLVSAFAGISHIRAAYQAALDNDYRFLSFGDAMLIM